MKKNKEIVLKNKQYGKILKEIQHEAIKVTGAHEAIIFYGTDHTLKPHLPMKEWDRSTVYSNMGKKYFSLVARFKVFVAKLQKVIPIRNYVEKDGRILENFGVISYLFNRCNYFYRHGITVLLVKDVKKYVAESNNYFEQIPVYSYDGYNFKRLEAPIRTNVRIVRIARSDNFISLHIPHFGILELNNVDRELLTRENESLLKDKLNRLISFINQASLTYFNQKGKFISETQRYEELIEKEEIILALGSALRKKEEELVRKTEALGVVSRQKFELELQKEKLSNEVVEALNAVKAIQEETDTNLASIAHTVKNFYMSQKNFSHDVAQDIGKMEIGLANLFSDFEGASKKYPKLNKYPFWKDLHENITTLKRLDQSLNINHKNSAAHTVRVMEYVLAVIAHQRHRGYSAESGVTTDLLSVFQHIDKVHSKRLKGLDIEFTYENKTTDSAILIDRMYHFILEEDIFINLLTNSIQALSRVKHKKRIWIDIELDTLGGKEFYVLHYRDSGPGIPADKKDAIFQGWSSKATDGTGGLDDKTDHGLGGQTVYTQIKNAGGSIKEVGKEGDGAYFIITFEKYVESKEDRIKAPETIQVSLKNAPKAPVPSDENQDLQGKTILIIDDDEAIRKYIATVFEGVLSPLFAAGHEEAWNHIYSNTPPDVITLDLDLLSSEKGENLLFDFNMRGVTRTIPIVVVSGADRAFEEDKLKKLGATDVLQKPVKDEVLRKRVYNILKNKK